MVLRRFRSSSSKMKLKKRIMDHDFKSSKENILNSEETSPKGSRREKYSKSVSESEADAGYQSPKSKARSEERRRSSRERRFIYGTFNQSAITDVYLGMPASKYDDNDHDHASRRHRKSSSSSPKSERRILRSPVLKSRRGRRPTKRSIAELSGNEASMPEGSESPTKEPEQPHTNDDMYTRIKRQRRASQRIANGDFVETDYVGKRSRRSAAKSAQTKEHPRRSLRKRVRLESEDREETVDDTPKDAESKDDDNKEAAEEAADGNGNVNGEDGEEEEEEEETSESSEEEAPRKYSLRERRAPPTHFQHELRESRFRRCRMSNLYGERSHSSNRDRSARRPRSRMHRSRALNRGSSSTSSSSSSSDSNDDPSNDEARFQRRKAKSMMRARQRCRPMNFTEEDLKANTALRDRAMIGGSLADVEPMTVDKNVTFENVGGLETVVRSLKEMILFPLMYSEVFDKFKVAPPRGVLFHGPPGTGKTLVARALANECSPEGGRKVAFFMRKGADCLSKWVGESERQLRLLFNEAYTMRPSIIFFDEIDGLAPVRSTRQDQIHSSIVSTLLALLDGLDSRGEVVVIGATNRLDAIDPALRRPGRFDREFYFPLPRETARQQILKIHTSVWPNAPSGNLLDRLAKATNGYCGADLKALCTEAVLSGLRRRYPQVYLSKAKLQLDTSEIEVCETDFQVAMESIVAAGARVESSASRPLSDIIMPLVKDTLEGIVERVRIEFPAAAQTLRQQVTGEDDADDHLIAEDTVDEHGKGQSWSRLSLGARGPQLLRRPRLLLLPDSEDMADQSWEERLSVDGGQAGFAAESSVLDQHLLPALFHRLEGIHVFTVDSPSLFNVSARTPEESLSQLWRESLRLAPSIIYMPRIDELLASLPDTVTHCLMCLMAGGDPSARVLVLATATGPSQALHPRVAHFFQGCSHRFTARPSKASRLLFFHDLFLKWPLVAPPLRRLAAQRVLEVLPVAQETGEVLQRRLNSRESAMLFEKEEYIMRQLRLFLRDVLSKLQRDRRFSIFARPVDPEEVPDYYQIIKKPMDLSTINLKINTHKYESVKEFLNDIDQICSNALEYNPDTTPADRELRNRACCLKDLAHAISKLDDNDDFNEKCSYVSSARRRRGLTSNCSLPNFYHTKPREPPPPALEPAVTPSVAPPPLTAPPTAPAAVPVTPVIKVSIDVPNKVAPASAPSKITNNLESMPSTPFGTIPRSATGHRLSRRLQHLAPEVVNKEVKERRHSKRHSDEHLSSKAGSHKDIASLGLSFDEEHGEKPAASRSGSECANSPPALSPVFSWHNGSRGAAALHEAVREAEEAEEAEEAAAKAARSEGAANHKTRHAAHTESKAQTPVSTRSNGGKKNEKQTPIVPRLTRGLAASNKLAEKAVSILEQPVPDLIVPQHELALLLDRCVVGTEGWSVTNLESIYSRLAARLLSFERVWDRTRLAAEYEEVLVEYAI